MNMKNTFLLFSVLFGMTTCTTIRKNADTQILDRVQSLKLVCNRKENIFIFYPWNYWFHDLKKEQTLNWNDAFIKSIQLDKHKKELLYVGQTVLNPYNSTMGILYRNAKAEELAKEVKFGMREKLLAENVFLKADTIGTYTYTVLNYQLRNDDLRAYAQYNEYYSNEGNDVLRIIFWSMESANDWKEVKDEGQWIMSRRSPVEPTNN